VEIVGVLRLRLAIRFADDVAPLRMTMCDDTARRQLKKEEMSY